MSDSSNAETAVPTGAPEHIVMQNLRLLLKTHREPINMLRHAVGEPLTSIKSCQQADNCFLLRYVLSYKGDIEKASEAVTKALEWRRKHSSYVKNALQADHYAQSAEFPPRMKPYLPIIRQLLAAWGHKSTLDGQPLVIIRINCCNFPALMSLVPIEVLVDYVVFSNEVEFWWCDRKTRELGELHKTFRLIDLKGMSAKSVDRRFFQVFSESSKISEFLHPQLVAKTVLLNAPSFIRWVVDALKAVGVSRRALDKIWVHKLEADKPIALHDDILDFLDPWDVPTFLGGQCECKGGCVPGNENSRTFPVEVNLEEKRSQIRKAKQEILAEKRKHKHTEKAPVGRPAGNNMKPIESDVLSFTPLLDSANLPPRPAGLPPLPVSEDVAQMNPSEDEDFSSSDDEETSDGNVVTKKQECDTFYDAEEADDEAIVKLLGALQMSEKEDSPTEAHTAC